MGREEEEDLWALRVGHGRRRAAGGWADGKALASKPRGWRIAVGRRQGKVKFRVRRRLPMVANLVAVSCRR